jgi:heme-degrading monooxygenase HmoA
MHVRLVSILFEPDKADELVRIYRDDIVPTAKKMKGFKGATLLISHERHQGMSITLWETEDDMIAGENNGYFQGQVAKLTGLLHAQPVESHYAIAYQTEPILGQD